MATRRWYAQASGVHLLSVLALGLLSSCESPPRAEPSTPPSSLRVGIGGLPNQTAENGVKQFISNISNEGLLRVNHEGRLEPWLAEGWTKSQDGLTLTVMLRQGVRFHDGSPVDAESVVRILNEKLPRALSSAFDDVESVAAHGEREIVIRLRQPSSFVADAFIDIPIEKAGNPPIGTGAFKMNTAPAPAPGDTTEVVASADYYQGQPETRSITIKPYPNVRAAWADMLRQQLDMLYEVGGDAIDAMRGAKNVTVYAFDRPYQYVLFFNTRNAKLKDPAVRRALNNAIDRDALVRDALGGRATPSRSAVSASHWAFNNDVGTLSYRPQEAATVLRKPLSLRCVTLAEQPFEQLALVVKQQLKMLGVDLEIEAVPINEAASALSRNDFETALLEYSSGWSLLRNYRFWHSQGTANQTHFSSGRVDGALDGIRHAVSDDEYKVAVTAFQQAIADDPPALFLAWSQRSRAVSNRFEVKQEPGRDVLSTLRSWHPRADNVSGTH